MLIEFAVAAVLAAVVAAVTAPVLIAAGVWDHPNDPRKPHHRPTPSAGGLAAATGFAAALAALAFWPDAQWSAASDSDRLNELALAVTAAFAALTLGAIDDARDLAARPKFLLIAGLSLAIAAFVAHAETLPLGGPLVIPLGVVFGILGSALWVFTLSNSVNFMDGANGLSMGSMLIGLLGLAAIAHVHLAPHAAALALCGAGGVAGFLVWNFPNGRIFAGDAGALFVGVVASVAGLMLVEEGGVTPLIPPLLFFPLLADVLLTLAWRVRQGRPMLAAHRDHLFQIGLRAGMPHWRVSLAYWIATAHCVAVAFVASFGPRIAPSSMLGPQPGDVPVAQAALMQALGWVASLAPLIALVVLALVAMHVSDRVRRFAKARGHDAP